MDGILVVKSSDETYGMIPPKSLPSMDIPSIHGCKIHERNATLILSFCVKRLQPHSGCEMRHLCLNFQLQHHVGPAS